MSVNTSWIRFCYPIRLAYGYWKKTNDASPFDAQWKKAIETILRVCKEQQRKHGNGPYSFRRTSEWAIDAVPMGGVGYKVNPVGLICSTFRPSDDATIFSFSRPVQFLCGGQFEAGFRNGSKDNQRQCIG